jgi:hypothetical protein
MEQMGKDWSKKRLKRKIEVKKDRDEIERGREDDK